MRPRYAQRKRAFDLVIVVLLLPLTLVVLALIVLGIKLQGLGNPVWFTQTRTGRDGRPFLMYKFATMVKGAESMKEGLQHLNVLPPPDFKIPNDPRITRVGRVLRETSLDELPQLLNVLKGDMSLVGPRPTSFGPATWQSWHTERLEVPPGLTGRWQVGGRGEMTFDERVRLDISYARQQSLATDIGILFATAASVVQRKGQ